jgi:hypothetical protein
MIPGLASDTLSTFTSDPRDTQDATAEALRRGKPKLLVIGHARHGKDTLAEKICDKMDLVFTSSSVFVGQECVWEQWGRRRVWRQWGRRRYANFNDMFADRVNNRKTWADLISAYNTPDKTKTARTMFERGYDMYAGMRRRDEFNACRDAKLFDRVIWVDALKRLPPESEDSMELSAHDADLCCDNNGLLKGMDSFVESLQRLLHDDGYSVGLTGWASSELMSNRQARCNNLTCSSTANGLEISRLPKT